MPTTYEVDVHADVCTVYAKSKRNCRDYGDSALGQEQLLDLGAVSLARRIRANL